MAQLDPSRKHLEASKSQGAESSPTIKAPKAQTSPTFQQLIQGEASVWSPNSSPRLRKNNDQEEDHHNRKSVLMKVKERARRLRHSFSGKKQHHDHHLSSDNSTPSWGVRLEDYEVEEEDPEYLGAPMYESELAPENYKETARQHPREVHGIPENQVLTSSVKQEEEEEEEYHSPKGKEEHSNPNKTIAETVSDKLGPTYTAVSETVSEMLAPAYAAVSDATHNVANKFANLTVSTPDGTETGTRNAGTGINQSKESTKSPQTWDKGVSVKEYLMQKFEPGEDERALSQVISEKISPRRTPRDAGMVEKVKGAVSSFLWTEGSSQEATQSTKSPTDTQKASNEKASSPTLLSTTKSISSSDSSVSPTNSSTSKRTTSSHTSTTKTKASSRTSHSPTNASTLRASSLPHHTHVSSTNSSGPANSKRSLSAHAPIATTTASTITANSSTRNPSSTCLLKLWRKKTTEEYSKPTEKKFLSTEDRFSKFSVRFYGLS